MCNKLALAIHLVLTAMLAIADACDGQKNSAGCISITFPLNINQLPIDKVEVLHWEVRAVSVIGYVSRYDEKSKDVS